ncbi:LOW QUALITY PROTEIN: piggyBac transposable element-derived protein 4-like [Leptodactylus fuscus]
MGMEILPMLAAGSTNLLAPRHVAMTGGKSLWNCETGRHIFRATMCLERFHDISRVLRFDSKTDRMERRAKDKLAPIRNVWNQWVEILPKLYNSGENVTADEQLVAFRGRCPFRQYIPSKPAKYGIKIWTLCDSKSSYALNVQVYTGKAPDERPEKNQGMRVVLDLTHGLKGQNVTCDNFFTSYQLGQMLKKKQLTMLGTMRKNKPELPQGILSKREVDSSTFYFSGNTTVVSYVRKTKQVILMSTMHHDNAVSDREDRKPDIILDYNATKGAVDTLDQVISTYTCKRKTNRWPMILFYNILDVSAYNAFVLWREIDLDWNRNKLTSSRLSNRVRPAIPVFCTTGKDFVTVLFQADARGKAMRMLQCTIYFFLHELDAQVFLPGDSECVLHAKGQFREMRCLVIAKIGVRTTLSHICIGVPLESLELKRLGVTVMGSPCLKSASKERISSIWV